ncbi:hypothetical protein OSTOST_07399, partial [Ostertagia ostertagi]
MIVIGVPESRSQRSYDRVAHDRCCVQQLLDFLSVDCLPVACYRMGRASPTFDRLMKVFAEFFFRHSVSSESLFGEFCYQYEVLRCDRQTRRGGGVAIITKRMYSPQVVYSESVDEAYELISVDLDMALCKVRFVLAYRSPSCSTAAFEQLLKAIGDLVAGINTFLVLGDFNLPDIPWTDVSYPNPPGSLARRFLEMCDCLKLYQVVSEGTHGSNILDLVLTNNKEVVKDVVIRAPIGSSDHASVLFKLDLKIEEVVKLSLRRDFKKANFNDILTYL